MTTKAILFPASGTGSFPVPYDCDKTAPVAFIVWGGGAMGSGIAGGGGGGFAESDSVSLAGAARLAFQIGAGSTCDQAGAILVPATDTWVSTTGAAPASAAVGARASSGSGSTGGAGLIGNAMTRGGNGGTTPAPVSLQFPNYPGGGAAGTRSGNSSGGQGARFGRHASDGGFGGRTPGVLAGGLGGAQGTPNNSGPGQPGAAGTVYTLPDGTQLGGGSGGGGAGGIGALTDGAAAVVGAGGAGGLFGGGGGAGAPGGAGGRGAIIMIYTVVDGPDLAGVTESLLPPNATPLELVLAQTMAVQIGALQAPLRDLWNPATCPESILPWLAWTLAVEKWDSTLPLALKRARVASAIAIHRHKGTLQAVRDVIAAYGGTVQLTLWHEMTPPGPPFTFSLSIALGSQGGAAPGAAFIDGMVGDVSRAKGARDTFTFTIALNAIAQIGLFSAARAAVYSRLECSTTNA